MLLSFSSVCHPVVVPFLPRSFMFSNCFARPVAVGHLVKQKLQAACVVLSLSASNCKRQNLLVCLW